APAKRRSPPDATSSTPSRSNSSGWSRRCGGCRTRPASGAPSPPSARCTPGSVDGGVPSGTGTAAARASPAARRWGGGSAAAPRRTRRPRGTLSEKKNTALLTHELSEAREQQAATSEVLRVIASSLGDLKPVFETMLANAIRLCQAKLGSLFLREGEAFRNVC